jgi:hypothetical protein
MAMAEQQPTAAEIAAARDWIADCWPADEIAGLADTDVIAGITRHYDGGWDGFRLDSVPVPADPDHAYRASYAVTEVAVCGGCGEVTANVWQMRCTECGEVMGETVMTASEMRAAGVVA